MSAPAEQLEIAPAELRQTSELCCGSSAQLDEPLRKGRTVRQSNQVFRVFVSSTFDDLKAEREALRRNVFLELSDR